MAAMACSRAGYDAPTPEQGLLPATCSVNRSIGADCDDVCTCADGLGCVNAHCVRPQPPRQPCAGVSCSGHGVCASTDGVTAVCDCESGYVASSTTCIAQGCVATRTVTRCEQGDVRSFDDCGAALGIASICEDKVCGTPAQGTCVSGVSNDGFCCLASICGDSVTTGDEACDTNDGLFCEDYGYGEGTLTCADNCTRVDATRCTDVCGNGILENQEECDGTRFADERSEDYCDTYCYGANDHGPISCNANCTTFCNCYL